MFSRFSDSGRLVGHLRAEIATTCSTSYRVNFTNASKWQAEGIFKCFFPSAKAKEEAKARDLAMKNPPLPRKPSSAAVPVLSEEEIDELAKRFADAIPEGEMSVSFVSFVPVV